MVKTPKLTKAQLAVLDLMYPGNWYCSYELGASLRTMRALESRDIIQSRHEMGSEFSPRTNILWRKVFP